MKTCAVLPLKPFGDAKERLATGLDPARRALLAEAMARDVLAALGRSRRVDATAIVSNEPRAQSGELGGERIAAVLPDERTSHSDAAAIGVHWAIDNGFARVLCVPGDCPLLDAEALDELLDRCAEQRIELAVIPDRLGTGTNGLVLAPPDAIAPAFGPGSRERHLALGLAAGRRTIAAEFDSLALDLDTADDLTELAERIAGDDHDALNTEQAIADLLTDRTTLPGGYAR